MRREACHELKRLPKITGELKSINFRRTTPGSLLRVLYGNKPPPPSAVVDPTHPALRYGRTTFSHVFRWRSYTGFMMRAVPKALLAPPLTRHPDPPYTLNEGPMKGRSANMSLLDCMAKSVGGRAIRQDILRKFKTTISLIVVRGADVEGKRDNAKIVFRAEDAGRAQDWILSDWTYIIRPSLAVYGMPYTEFIPQLRKALREIVSDGRRMESQWAQLAIKHRGQTSARSTHAMSRPRQKSSNAMHEESGLSTSRPSPPPTPHIPAGDRASSYTQRASGSLINTLERLTGSTPAR
ncbi:hypothetical protein C8Q73DRAFT_674291 [Cubamyces lactineus]|nr:hypothetical protein C8Q73DRAFT_674291 [Cubamyces lactineus]